MIHAEYAGQTKTTSQREPMGHCVSAGSPGIG
jgi:hypothetical protein